MADKYFVPVDYDKFAPPVELTKTVDMRRKVDSTDELVEVVNSELDKFRNGSSKFRAGAIDFQDKTPFCAALKRFQAEQNKDNKNSLLETASQDFGSRFGEFVGQLVRDLEEKK